MRHRELLAVFPTPFGAEDHENRGVNDREIRFRPFKSKVYAHYRGAAEKAETGERTIE